MTKRDTETADLASDRRMIPVDLIDPNPWNGHRAADADLNNSIAQHGILQNLIVRPIGTRFQIVSGSRRYDAARLTLHKVPCLVREMTDHEARTVTIIENLQRENLHPVAEAHAIAALLNDHTTAEVAARIGKTPAFVTRRAKLALIAPEIVGSAGVDIQRASVRALELLATLPREEQVRIWEEHGGVTIDADDIARHLAFRQKTIKDAMFDCADATLYPEAGACTACDKRTGAELMLFDDYEPLADDRCLDTACFEQKCARNMARLEAIARQKHGDALMLGCLFLPYGDAGTALKKRGAVELSGDWEPCKKADEGARPVFMAYGVEAQIGKTLYWKPKAKPAPAPEAPPADSIEAKHARLYQRRWSWIATELATALRENPLPAKAYMNERELCRIAASFGGFPRDDGYDYFMAPHGAGDHAARIWAMATEGLRQAIQVARVTDLTPDFVGRLKAVSDLCGMDWAELEADAIEAIPEPKAWARA